MIKEILVGTISGGVLAIAGYILVVKENQVNIEHIKKDLQEIKEIGRKNDTSITATNLFVAQAHPDRDASTLVTTVKLKEFNNEEIYILADTISDVKLGSGNNNDIINAPAAFNALVEKYNLTGDDVVNLHSVANMPFVAGAQHEL